MEAGHNSRKKWEIINSFLNRRMRHDDISKISHNGVDYVHPIHIANAFCNFFSSHDQSDTSSFEPNYPRLPHSFFLFPTTPREIFSTIQNQKVTSSGLDNIHPSQIKMVAHLISEVLSHIINLMFKRGVFPEELKRGKIVPVFKNGDRSLLSNYRPICILPFFSKIIEK